MFNHDFVIKIKKPSLFSNNVFLYEKILLFLQEHNWNY